MSERVKEEEIPRWVPRGQIPPGYPVDVARKTQAKRPSVTCICLDLDLLVVVRGEFAGRDACMRA